MTITLKCEMEILSKPLSVPPSTLIMSSLFTSMRSLTVSSNAFPSRTKNITSFWLMCFSILSPGFRLRCTISMFLCLQRM